MRPPCHVIHDVITMKKKIGIIWDDLFISEVTLKRWVIFQNFQNGCHFELSINFFLPEVTPEVEYTRKIAISISDILSY